MARQYNENSTAVDFLADLSGEGRGKIILVTGILPRGLARTSSARLRKANPSVKARALSLDLGSLVAARKVVDAPKTRVYVARTYGLLNNAELIAVDYPITPEGFESQFEVNHASHFFFTKRIIGRILASLAEQLGKHSACTRGTIAGTGSAQHLDFGVEFPNMSNSFS